MKELDIGNLTRSFCKCPDDVCLSIGSNVQENLAAFTLQNKFWLEKMNFPSESDQLKFFTMLKSLNGKLYDQLDPKRRTVFLRLTGDNFRAACKYPTEQISYSVLNNKEMLHSPYSQFISSLWRGSESRINIEIHTLDHYLEIKSLLTNGLRVVNKDGEYFNILPMMCADLCFVKEVLGKMFLHKSIWMFLL